MSVKGIDGLLKRFDWCKNYISGFLLLYTAYFTINQFIENQKNIIHSTLIAPQIDILYNRLENIKEKNYKIFEYISHNGKVIISDITVNTKMGKIENKKELNKYFFKYISNNIPLFEKCGYNYDCNGGNCSSSKCKKEEPIYIKLRSHSLKSLKSVLYELFCISPNYISFEKDIENLYYKEIKKRINPEEYKKNMLPMDFWRLSMLH